MNNLWNCYSLNLLIRVRIRQLVRNAGRSPTLEERQDIERKRQRVAGRIRDFHTTSYRLLGAATVNALLGAADKLNDDGYVSDEVRQPEDRGLVPRLSEIENNMIVFPSSATSGVTPTVSDLRNRELRLRHAKANDSLARIRETLSSLSYQYINKVRQSVTTRDHLKAYDGIKTLSKEVSFFQQVYNRNSRAIERLDPNLRKRYPRLRRSDCTINTAIADVNARGQSQVRLPWFWGALDGWEENDVATHTSLLDNDRLLECKSHYQSPNLSDKLISLVYRVNWMRARAQKNRWEEELPRTEKEMIWTTRYFMHQSNVWHERLCGLRQTTPRSSGQEAYCEEKLSQWEELGRIADTQFRQIWYNMPATWKPTGAAS